MYAVRNELVDVLALAVNVGQRCTRIQQAVSVGLFTHNYSIKNIVPAHWKL